jgi:hypothetical protein
MEVLLDKDKIDIQKKLLGKLRRERKIGDRLDFRVIRMYNNSGNGQAVLPKYR